MERGFKIISKLGEGSFADVFKVKFEGVDGYYAIKRLKERYKSMDQVRKIQEIEILKALRGHPNIIDLAEEHYDVATGYVFMVFEVMDQNLYELISAVKEPVCERVALLYIYQMLKGLAHMHSKLLFHRDIKPENCMINTSTLELKLVDFGSVKSFTAQQPFTEYVSTRWYRAPECILTSGSYGPTVDVWAVGCILYELLTNRPLFPGTHEVDQIAKINRVLGSPDHSLLRRFMANPNTEMDYCFEQCRGVDLSELLPTMSMGTVDLMRGLLVYNPSDRLSAVGALSHPVFAPLRSLEQRWQVSRESIPFPLFVARDGREPKYRPLAPLKPAVTHKVNRVLEKTRVLASHRIREYGKKQKGPKRVYFSIHAHRLMRLV